jgi:hypothetical protein
VAWSGDRLLSFVFRLTRDGVQFCSGLVDLVVCARRVVIAVAISGTDADVRGLRAKPAILAAGS